jgi:hypothetical protein
MPFTVKLREGVHDGRTVETLHGVVLPMEEIEDRRWKFPLLRGIDPYSGTYFGQLQLSDLADELAELAR